MNSYPDVSAVSTALPSDPATAVAVLLPAWGPRRRGPRRRGATREELAASFPGWKVTDLGLSEFSAPRPVELLMKPNEHWYRLRRR